LEGVDKDGCELDILVTKERDKSAEMKFFRELFKGQSQQSRRIFTDKLRSYKAALRDLNCKISHSTECYKYNVAELSHQKKNGSCNDKYDSSNQLAKRDDFLHATG
jgi:putative transposase